LSASDHLGWVRVDDDAYAAPALSATKIAAPISAYNNQARASRGTVAWITRGGVKR